MELQRGLGVPKVTELVRCRRVLSSVAKGTGPASLEEQVEPPESVQPGLSPESVIATPRH